MFPGLIPILNSYLENMEVDVDTRCSILNYLKLIKKRASGTVEFLSFLFLAPYDVCLCNVLGSMSPFSHAHFPTFDQFYSCIHLTVLGVN